MLAKGLIGLRVTTTYIAKFTVDDFFLTLHKVGLELGANESFKPAILRDGPAMHAKEEQISKVVSGGKKALSNTSNPSINITAVAT